LGGFWNASFANAPHKAWAVCGQVGLAWGVCIGMKASVFNPTLRKPFSGPPRKLIGLREPDLDV